MKTRSFWRFATVAVMAIFLVVTGTGLAEAKDFHKAPRAFLFGNHIDTHQETELVLSKNGTPEHLSGFFYVIYTGEIDAASGLPIARHRHAELCRFSPNMGQFSVAALPARCITVPGPRCGPGIDIWL